MIIRSLPELKVAIQDHRIMERVREFAEDAPREKLIAKDWELCVELAYRMTVKPEMWVKRLLETHLARVEAWSILNPGKVPKGII
jgi:hypothetical protein